MIQIPEDKELIKKFIETNHAFKSSVADHNTPTAEKTYQELYAFYHKINESSLEQIHKEVAYQQIVEAYHSLQDLKQDTMSPTNIIAIAVVIVIVSTIIFINPRIIGLAVFQEQTTQAVNIAFSYTNSQAVQLKSVPSSLAVSGKVTGNAKLFAEIDGRKLLVLDTEKLKATTFRNECLDTCVLPVLGSKNVVFNAEVQNGQLTINEITYYSKKTNHAPVWTGEPQKITLQEETTIDFAPYFSDTDEDELVYLASSSEGAKTSVSGSKVTLTPEQGFTTATLTIIASDLEYSTKANIQLSS
ncbi:hypothetical protein HY484_02370 [Candidatus Woesearchaeota archaeon]|nr:hypothetical protein [Candidatus Woesearchaeota archaeon]